MCKVTILKDRGDHFEIQDGGIKLHDPDCYHINKGIISLLKNMVRLCPSTGNGNIVWPMH